MRGDGSGFTVTATAGETAVHAFVSVTVTVYEPPRVTTMRRVRSPPDHT